MQVWVDADACPSEIKELLFRAAKRKKVKVTLVANQQLRTPKSEYVDSIVLSTSLIYFAVRRYRDRVLGGGIRFGKALLTGLFTDFVEDC